MIKQIDKMEKKKITNTDYSFCFEDVDMQSTFLLPKEVANNVWAKKVDGSSSSYFTLNDDSWIVKAEKQHLGNWLENYSDESNVEVEQILNQALDWVDSQIVFFCLNKHLAIETKWGEFKHNWRNFLCVDDDCPLIINPEKNTSIIIFAPIGNLIKITG
jgi:hypothetical protein